MVGGERHLELHLPDGVIDHLGEVPGVELPVFGCLAKLFQTRKIVVDLPDWAARIVAPGQYLHRHPEPLGVSDGRTFGVELRAVRGRTAKERPVESLLRLHRVLEGSDVIGHRLFRNPQRPKVRLRAQAEQRQVSTPGAAGQDDPSRIGNAPVDRVSTHCGYVGELGEAGIALYGITPILAVARASAVVHVEHGKAMVDPGQGPGKEFVARVARWPTMVADASW